MFSNVSVENWAGKLGARMSNSLIHNGFGVASFFIPFVLIVMGLRLLNVRLLPIGWTILTSAIGMVILSLVLGFIFSEKFLGNGLGGAHGYFMANWLTSFLGGSGA